MEDFIDFYFSSFLVPCSTYIHIYIELYILGFGLFSALIMLTTTGNVWNSKFMALVTLLRFKHSNCSVLCIDKMGFYSYCGLTIALQMVLCLVNFFFFSNDLSLTDAGEIKSNSSDEMNFFNCECSNERVSF